MNTSQTVHGVDNLSIAQVLDRIADLLAAKNANPHRIRAYRKGANRIRSLKQPLAEMVKKGQEEAIQNLPDIGEGLALVIQDIVKTGRSGLLEQLEGEISPEKLFARVPGIGETLADRIDRQLGIHSLEELERAAHSGKLQDVEGFGPKRVQGVRASLAGLLSPSAQRRARTRTTDQTPPEERRPGIDALLEVDREYREKAQSDALPRIAPRRFNPEHRAWLPILHASRQGWAFTALYSNTARAHELQKTHDWVVIYFKRDSQPEDQATVVTATQGRLAGKRIVRGRESECERYYLET